MNATTQPTWRAIDEFAAAIAVAGLGTPDIIADGRIHRFRTDDDKAGSRSGWYLLHLDRHPAGVFGSWKLSFTQTWSAKTEAGTAPLIDFRAMIKTARRQRDAEQQATWTRAAYTAASVWPTCPPAPADHPYLLKKEIGPHVARLASDNRIALPIGDGSALTSLQFIAADGSKRFLTGGRIAGCWCPIEGDGPESPILIGEGFATVATMAEVTGSPGVVAFNAGNLLPVSKTIRRLNPHADIIILGDDDRWTEGNPGRAKARSAALEIGAKVLFPDFADMDLDSKPTDWNDWYRLARAAGRVKV
ncbi:toprim domain-containing protein [Thiocapsa rosea]|uniref:Putative DNA primase/helicase n=1 Tax=Thiocapsa rosea TaxID=69360 RepID=A0A495VDQ2_9GAMM|nr:toprim domain-containing protein [Thiocapsa rosea]RKT47492.1 putative DNA primase/helicase [Thiocapsa rosea]